ncbi:hypothetical protein SteCoe_15635 [Stentor coeruleus]|uniref:Uncharacterized protein n=1 Tax=Stentor coeruleus TaxID=5963 RepID=A0A1R2C3F2_9CILI|nr:hypothetical protein SteCoe_15635 [Stentor coeruleus]
MLADSCCENLTSKLYQEYSIKLHKKRLEEIKHRDTFSQSLPQDFIKKEHKKPSSFLQIAKANEINRENQILNDKISAIFERKFSPKVIQKYKSPQTLNSFHRRQEKQKIIQENKNFIQRLIERPSNFPLEKFKLEYEITKKYKENYSKQNNKKRIQKVVKNHPMTTAFESFSKVDTSYETKKKRVSSMVAEKLEQL